MHIANSNYLTFWKAGNLEIIKKKKSVIIGWEGDE